MKRFVLLVSVVIGIALVACGGGDEQVSGETDEGAESDEGDATDEGDGTEATSEATNDSSTEGASTDLESSLDDALGEDGSMSVDLGMTPASVGQPCAEDDDCGDGVTCLIEDPDLQEGQVAGGLCTLRCEQDPAVCGSSALCFGVDQGTTDASDDVAYCYEACLFTGAATKCADSINRVCALVDTETGLGVCNTKCFSDGECATGLSCLASFPYSCVEQLPDLLPDGATCEADAECAGSFCLLEAEDSTDGVCLSDCSLQTETAACGRDLGDSTPVGSACFPLLPVLLQNLGVGEGDLGQCLPTCDPDEGCPHPDWACLDLDDEGYTDDVGYAGVCLPRVLLDEGEPVLDEEEMGMGGAMGMEQEGTEGTDTEQTVTDETEEMTDTMVDMGIGGAPAVGDAGAN